MALKHDLLQRVVVQNHSKNQWKWWSLWWLNMSNREGSSRSYSFWNRNGSKCEVSKGTATSSKKQPQKSWTTLFTTPFINHFREWAHFIYYPFINHYSTLIGVSNLGAAPENLSILKPTNGAGWEGEFNVPCQFFRGVRTHLGMWQTMATSVSLTLSAF